MYWIFSDASEAETYAINLWAKSKDVLFLKTNILQKKFYEFLKNLKIETNFNMTPILWNFLFKF